MALEGRDDQLYQDRAWARGWPGLLQVCRDRPGAGCGGLDRSSGAGLSPILLRGQESGLGGRNWGQPWSWDRVSAGPREALRDGVGIRGWDGQCPGKEDGDG